MHTLAGKDDKQTWARAQELALLCQRSLAAGCDAEVCLAEMAMPHQQVHLKE
jgi:hypothetical protein